MSAQSSGASSPQNDSVGSRLIGFVTRVCSMATVHRNERKLRLCETLSLGEKRFIAVVEYDRNKFLLAGTPESISLLQRLDVTVEKNNADSVTVLKTGMIQDSEK